MNIITITHTTLKPNRFLAINIKIKSKGPTRIDRIILLLARHHLALNQKTSTFSTDKTPEGESVASEVEGSAIFSSAEKMDTNLIIIALPVQAFWGWKLCCHSNYAIFCSSRTLRN
jgi:hypothetical protein